MSRRAGAAPWAVKESSNSSMMRSRFFPSTRSNVAAQSFAVFRLDHRKRTARSSASEPQVRKFTSSAIPYGRVCRYLEMRRASSSLRECQRSQSMTRPDVNTRASPSRCGGSRYRKVSARAVSAATKCRESLLMAPPLACCPYFLDELSSRLEDDRRVAAAFSQDVQVGSLLSGDYNPN